MNIDMQQVQQRITQVETPTQLEDIAPDGRIGLVALATDYNLEQDIRRMLPDSVQVFTNRVLNFNPLTRENLEAMAGDIGRAAAGLLPGVGVDVAIYGCTSGTAMIGLDRIRNLINTSLPDALVTTPLVAAAEAFKHLSVKNVSLLTPYDLEINSGLIPALEAFDINVSKLVGLGFDNDLDVTCVPPEEILQLGLTHADRSADALFISCTSFRASLVIEKLEQALGMPVVSSNQALAWHAMQLLQCNKPVSGFGRLFEQ